MIFVVFGHTDNTGMIKMQVIGKSVNFKSFSVI